MSAGIGAVARPSSLASWMTAVAIAAEVLKTGLRQLGTVIRLLKEESHQILGCAFDVLNEIGHGFACQRSFPLWFSKSHVPA